MLWGADVVEGGWMKMIKDMFDPGETLIWEGKPDKAAYVIGPVFLFVIAGVMFLIALLSLGILISFGNNGEVLKVTIFIMALNFIAAIVMGVALPIYRSMSWKNINYAITDKRIYIETGILGTDIAVKDFSDISNPEVSVDYIDKIRNCGSVHLGPRYYVNRSGRKMYTLAPALNHIADPYGVFDMIKKMSVDIKSDIYYPNAFRPEDNKGFSTDYRPK